MSYEIIDNPSENTNTEVTPDAGTDAVQTTDSGNPADGATPENVADAPTDENAGGEPPATEGEPDHAGDPAPTDDTPAEFYWGGESVNIEIADDVNDALKEKGIDAMAIAKELYAKDGEFSLSDETKQKLYDAFGKFSVDAYLSGLKAQNEMFIMNTQRDAEKAEQANAERYSTISKEIGGDEGWGKLEEFALATLSDDELAAFNEVMNSGNQYLQVYAVRELESRRTKAQGDDAVSLIPGNAATVTEGGPLSRQDYYAEMQKLSVTYKHDKAGAAAAQAALDARRRAGMAKGL